MSDKKPSMRQFFTLWGGQALSLIGSGLVQFALVWYLTEHTGSATVLAMASLVALLPQILISPVAGALVDKWNRRLTMIGADGLVALATLALSILFTLGMVEVWHIYVVLFIRALGGAFHWPAMQASTTLMVEKDHLPRINGLNQSLQGISGIAAPPLGALLISLMPVQGVLWIDIGTALLAILPLLFVPVPQPEATQGGAGKASTLENLKAGLRFAGRHPAIRTIIGMAMLINLLAVPAFTLLPILITGHFGGGAAQYAALQTAFGVGLVIGGLALGAWGGFKSRARTSMTFMLVMGLGLGAVGFVPPDLFIAALVALIVGGAANSILNGSMFTLLQDQVPPEMQARVFTLVISGATAMVPIGLSIAGPLADQVGVRPWFVLAGLCLLATSAYGFLNKDLMSLEETPVELALPLGGPASEPALGD
jgi:DHA3 family macrolide efflux protein-like MFS transporter